MLFTLTIVIETICLLVALFCLSKAQMGWWKSFLPFLLLTVTAETTGYILFFVQGKNNHWVFNLYLLPEMCFLFLVLFKLSREYFNAHYLLIPGFIFFLFFYIMESFQSGWLAYSSQANTIASVIIIAAACQFYYYLLKKETDVDIMYYPAFWIISGLFIFYLGSIGVGLFVNQLTQVYKSTGLPLRFIIMVVLNFILYASWGYAFLCRYRQKILFS